MSDKWESKHCCCYWKTMRHKLSAAQESYYERQPEQNSAAGLAVLLKQDILTIPANRTVW